MNCPKCAYARKLKETAPEGQCPSCGIYYAKFNAPARPPGPMEVRASPDTGGSWKIVLGVVVTIIAGIITLMPAPAWVRVALTSDDAPAGGAPRKKLSEMDFSKAQIVMYSLTTCGYCVSMRRTLEANNIPFTEYFVDADQSRLDEMMQKLQSSGYRSGGVGTPTLEVNGKMMPNNPPFEDVIRQARRT